MSDGDNTTEWFTDYDFVDQVKTVNVEFHVSTNIWVDDSIRDPRTLADPHQKKYSTWGPHIAPTRTERTEQTERYEDPWPRCWNGIFRNPFIFIIWKFKKHLMIVAKIAIIMFAWSWTTLKKIAQVTHNKSPNFNPHTVYPHIIH